MNLLTVSLTVTALAVATEAFANCNTVPEAAFWSNVQSGSRLPDPPISIILETGPNPAVPSNTAVYPFNTFAGFDASVAGNARRCTAQFVAPNMVLTAAHCVRDKNGTWLDFFEFDPVDASVSDKATAMCMATLASWVTGNTGNFDWSADIAFVVFTENISINFLDLAGTELEPITGVLATGFPRAVDGGQMLHDVPGQAFAAHTLGTALPAMGQGSGLIVHGDPRLSLGMSGGAWLVPPLEGQDRYRVVGLSATQRHLSLLGPTVQSCAHQLFSFAVNGCEAR